MKTLIAVCHVAVAFVLLLSACGGAGPVAQEVTLRAREFGYDPTSLSVKAGQPVRLTLVNEGKVDHTFAVVGLLKAVTVRSGSAVKVEFTPASSGDYKFLCTVPGHEALGMAGTLTASP